MRRGRVWCIFHGLEHVQTKLIVGRGELANKFKTSNCCTQAFWATFLGSPALRKSCYGEQQVSPGVANTIIWLSVVVYALSKSPCQIRHCSLPSWRRRHIGKANGSYWSPAARHYSYLGAKWAFALACLLPKSATAISCSLQFCSCPSTNPFHDSLPPSSPSPGACPAPCRRAVRIERYLPRSSALHAICGTPSGTACLSAMRLIQPPLSFPPLVLIILTPYE